MCRFYEHTSLFCIRALAFGICRSPGTNLSWILRVNCSLTHEEIEAEKMGTAQEWLESKYVQNRKYVFYSSTDFSTLC
jgi:hypothetical protein